LALQTLKRPQPDIRSIARTVPAAGNLVQGQNDVSLHPELARSLSEVVAEGLNHYSFFEGVDELRRAVAQHRAPLGLAFDGDADRCAFVDQDGRTVHADLITVILARGMLQRFPGKGIIYDLRSSKVVPQEILKLGGRPVRERVGHSFMKETLRRQDCIGGGELSGHFYFAENYYTDCGVLAAILVLNQLSQEKRSLKAAADELRKYHGTGEINFKVADKDALMMQVERKYATGRIDHLDGVTVTFTDWWVNVRPSNTEPYLRMCLEADTRALMEQKRGELFAILGDPVDH